MEVLLSGQVYIGCFFVRGNEEIRNRGGEGGNVLQIRRNIFACYYNIYSVYGFYYVERYFWYSHEQY